MTPTPPWAERLASAFWERAGGRPPPPRDPEAVASLTLPVAIQAEHPVTRAAIRRWLERRGRSLPRSRREGKRLYGCVVAYRGHAVIVVDATLELAWRRVIVAHELGHYLAEYLWPRELVIRRLGESVLPVLDGDRKPTEAETWAGVLAGVRVGLHAHYLERGFDPTGESEHSRSERRANVLAYELLAPWREVLTEAADSDFTVEQLLVERYGLPCEWVRSYADRLNRYARRSRPPSQLWGL